ncbi:aminopeptidase P family protein [Acetobacter tropicalis]|uniref:Xaa-Pro aminopeptidase n=1 Tax=Acetobacter tropicalis NBRC 101654 TaxID=749388 RepID=F7VEV5_9PROT|nr:aminopeptidase P family protein [Acetobacter tropicalis]GAA08900.1 Xaa-Pro aminopeptidase [Acetobacter tropicalis NBRC 101654]
MPSSSPSERLTALRSALSGLGVDGFFLPRGDEHLGEYVPVCAERLAWLTGFTGSAGLALVLPDTAAVFSDGRYQVQMRQQVDTSLWSVEHMYETPPPLWLAKHARGKSVGFDPRSVSVRDIEALEQAGCHMVALRCNPVDDIWADRPKAPATPVCIQPLALTGRENSAKIQDIADTLRQAGQDSVILPDPTSIAWLLNIRGRDLPFLPVALCFAILHADATVDLFINIDRIDDAVRSHLGTSVRVHMPADMGQILHTMHGKTVRLDPARCPIWFANTLKDVKATLAEGTDPCLMPRACKTPAELDGMRRAHLLDGIALTRFLCWVEAHGVGKTEASIADHLLALRREAETCIGPSFHTIAGSGPNAAIMHYAPTAEQCSVVQSDAFLLVDSGGQYTCATTDVTRTVWLGAGSPPEDWKKQYTCVLQGLIAMDQAVFPAGTHGYRLDPLARLALWREGLDFDHGAGHGVGSCLSVHEWPLGFTRRPVLDPLHEHMVMTNEPGFYAPGSHGMRLENQMETCLAYKTETGDYLRFKTLTLAPIDTRGIIPERLTDTERTWLNSYHARVLEQIGPHLAREERAWLQRACAPL